MPGEGWEYAPGEGPVLCDENVGCRTNWGECADEAWKGLGAWMLLIMPGSLNLLSVVCKDGRLWLLSGECVDADRGGDFCMAGRMLCGSASDGLMANLARVGDMGVESSSRLRSSADRPVSVLIGGGGGGSFGGGFVSYPVLVEEGGLGLAKSFERPGGGSS
jgi:hypothetical protein